MSVVTSGPPVSRPRLLRGRGFKAAAQWVGLEVAARWGLAVLLLSVGLGLLLADAVASTVGLLLLALFFRRKIRGEGASSASFGYRRSGGILAAGLLSGVALLAIASGAQEIDLRVFPGLAQDSEALLSSIVQGGPVAAGALLVVNGAFVPIVEEFAWRGYIQTTLTDALGVRGGIGATALLFAGKHMLVDLSFNRSVTLLLGGLALGMIRQWKGTTASTIAHIVLNLVATAMAVASAL